jgi:outer membrane protein TolC
VGALPRTSVLESEAEVARREADLVRARALRRIARDNLRAVINFKDPDSDALIMVEPSDAPSLTDFKRDLAASLDSGLHNRPELIAARLNVDSKMLLEKAAQNQLLPRLDFVGSIGLNGLAGSDATPLSFAGDISGPLACADPENPAPGVVCADPRVVGGYGRSLELLRDGRFYQYNFGVQLEIPVGNAAAKAEYTQAKINAERSKLSMRELEENVTLEIKTAVDNLNSLMTSVEATRVARELAEENVRNQRARYDVGLATTKDLIDFSQRLTVARQSEIQSLTTYESGIADLRRAEGSLLEHRNIELYRRPPEEPKWWARF